MTSEIKLFNYGDNAVRTIEKDGEVWFVAKDVCDILELKNPSDALKSLDNDERSSLRISEGTSPKGGNPNFNVISEAGLYKLAFRSNKPIAKDFTRWVTHEVIPAIFRTGSYSVQQESSVPAVYETSEDDELEPKLNYLSGGRQKTILKILDEVFNGRETVDEEEVKKVLSLDKVFENSTGISALEIIGIKLKKETTATMRDITFEGATFPYVEYKTIYSWEDNLIEDYFAKH